MLTPILLDELLALATPDAQVERLRAAHLLNESGLSALLDAAEQTAGDDPDRSQRLAAVAEQAAGPAAASAIPPRAAYLQAQVQAIKGEFDVAERLIARARQGYETLGLRSGALRTTAGLMRVLGETGRYPDALAAGQAALAEIGAEAEGPPAEAAEQRAIAAMILQNCGHCYEQIGRYDEALHAYAAAERRYAELGLAESRGHIVENRGLVLVALGQVQAGLAAFEEALALYAEEGRSLYRAQTYINIGEAHLLLGNYLPSLQAFEEAARRLDSLGETVDRFILLRQMGDAYLALNLYAEAEEVYRQAHGGLAAAGLTLHDALALWGLGTVLAARGWFNEAGQAMAAAAQHLGALDNRPLLSAVLLEESRLREQTGDAPGARSLAQQSLDLVSNSNWQVQKIYAYLRNADLALPDEAAAERLLVLAQPLVDTLQLPQLHYRLQQRWGHLRLRQGDVQGARRHLENAIDEIERLRSTLVQERLRAAFLQDKMAAYQDLIRLHLEQDDPESIHLAFAVAEQSKSRALVDLIAGAIQARLGETQDEEARQQLHQLQAELNAVYSAMLGGPDDGSVRTAGAVALQARATQLEQAISQRRVRHLAAGTGKGILPGTAATVWTGPAPAAVDPLLVYHVLDDEIFAFVCLDQRVHLVRRLASVRSIRQLSQGLAAQWARFAIHPSFISQHRAQLEQTTERLLRRLHGALVAPLLPILAQEPAGKQPAAGNLVIVPHGLLHQLPFHAFHDGERYLVERFAISYAPSATVYELCRQRHRRQDGLALALAAPDARIPAAVTEVHQVAARLRSYLPAPSVHVSDQATHATLRATAGQCRILHLACHGLFRHDNPMFSALKLSDGWLTAAHVAELDLQGALVTLSACESGRSPVLGGDEIMGLTYAFLSAGAVSLVASQWLVQDDVTAALMGHWYDQLGRTEDLAAALRAAQLAILAQYRHPYYWAPFSLVGQRTPA